MGAQPPSPPPPLAGAWRGVPPVPCPSCWHPAHRAHRGQALPKNRVLFPLQGPAGAEAGGD